VKVIKVFVQPTVFADVNDHHRIAREEVMNEFICFESFFCLFRFKDFWTGDANFKI